MTGLVMRDKQDHEIVNLGCLGEKSSVIDIGDDERLIGVNALTLPEEFDFGVLLNIRFKIARVLYE